MASDIKTVDLTIALPLRELGRQKKSIRQKLDGLVTHYIPEADGVLIKWQDLTILNDKGIIIDDQPFVFWKVSFTAHVFKPIKGKIVRGKVHEVQKSYFIAKAMNSFTVTVTIPEELVENEVVQNIMIEQDVYFKIKGYSEGAYKAEFDHECLELTKNSIDETATTGDNVYDYAKDFEY